MARGRSTKSSNNNSANIGFDQKLWLAAEKLRSNMDAGEYKHVVLGLIFLKYISASFRRTARPRAGERQTADDQTEDRDEYTADNIFWVNKIARWCVFAGTAPSSPPSATYLNDAMVAVEKDNPTLKGVLPKGIRPPRARQAPARRTH